jgi:hypothetical protein
MPNPSGGLTTVSGVAALNADGLRPSCFPLGYPMPYPSGFHPKKSSRDFRRLPPDESDDGLESGVWTSARVNENHRK